MPHDNESLQARLDALEKADRAKDQFLSLLSHEFRNHIHAIRTNVWLINARNRDPEIARPSEAIDRQVTRLSRLVEDLLDSIHVANKSNLAFGTTVLQHVVHAAVEGIKGSMDMHRRELAVEMPEKPIYVCADAPRLQQVVAALLSNAIKYSPQQAQVHVRVAREANDAVVSVRDAGHGIAAADMERIFNPFVNGSPAPRMEGAQGLGISLHVSRELVEAHEGTLEARSAGRDQGAEFIVRVPAIEPPEEEAVQAKQGDVTDTHQPGDRPLDILVVDDNRDAADSLAEVLGAYGHRVRVAYGGEEALQVVQQGGVQVALVDIGMPTVDGFEVARRISRDRPGGDPLLVAVTGWGEKADRERSREAGFAYHLTKPVDFDALASLLSTAARRAQAVRA
jgi:CheY-like chemotaxis protein/two-component sensor histidine kinase